MSRCLNLTHAGEYAIAALARLALEEKGAPAGYTSIETLARLQDLPKTFLAKIMRQCAKAGLVRAAKGPGGGVRLAFPPEGISLLAIIEACEGSYRRTDCVFYPARACSGAECQVFCPLRKDEEAVTRRLEGTSLASMAAALKIHPDAGFKTKTGGLSCRQR